jgi:photosystem II stability/assembly factor-like uncharacterized protein
MPTRQLLTAVFFVDDKHGWAVGHDAQILASRTAAHLDQAIRRPQARSAAARCLVQGRQHGFAVGAYGALMETTDGGKHWEDVSDRLDNEDQFHLNAIAAVKDAGLFIVGEQGSMFRSSRRGPDLGKTPRPLRGLAVRRDRHRPGQTLLAYGLRGNLFAPPISADLAAGRTQGRPWRPEFGLSARCSMTARW